MDLSSFDWTAFLTAMLAAAVPVLIHYLQMASTQEKQNTTLARVESMAAQILTAMYTPPAQQPVAPVAPAAPPANTAAGS